MAGQRGLDGDLGGLVVADLTDQHHVGVGTQNRPQRGGEGQTRLGVDLHLVDAGHPVLDRVLDRDHVDLGLRDRVQGRVQGRRLAGTGGAGDQDHAVGLGVALPVDLEVAFQQVEGFEAHGRGRVVEDTHDDLLAPHRGQRRNTQVDLATVVDDGDPPILGLAPLGDVDVGHDLESADHAALDRPGCPLHLVQYAVDAVPHPHVVLGGLDMDVGGAVGDGLADDQVDEAHDRAVVIERIIRTVVDRRQVFFEGGGQRFQFAVGAHVAVDRRGEILGLSDDGADLHAGGSGDVVNREHIAGINHGEGDLAADQGDRQDVVATAHGRRHQHDRSAVHRVIRQFHERHVGLGGDGRGELALGDGAGVDE